jgi:hypothetical protein
MDVYVSPSGNDHHTGSRKHPWRTLQHAAHHLRPGATVHVAPGRYAGPVAIRRGGTSTKPVRFVADRRWQARISSRGATAAAVVAILGDHVRFEGFDVPGTGRARAGIVVEGRYDAVVGNRVHDLSVACSRSGDGGAGIIVGGGGVGYRNHDGLVEGNLVERIGRGPRDGTCRLVHGVYAAARRVTIVNNIVSGAAGDGITSWHAASALSIANNLSVANGGAGILVGSGDAGATRTGNIGTVVSNNIVARNALQGIAESTDGSHPAGPGNQYLNNLSFANGAGGAAPDGWITALYPGEITAGNLDADPLLTAPGAGAGAYRLPAMSPAVDAGTFMGAPRHDFDGARRPQGRGFDIGPIERPARVAPASRRTS